MDLARLLLLSASLVSVYADVEQEIVCGTPSCVDFAKAMKYSMDTSVDPCDNFYKFACGGYVNKTVVPDNEGSISRVKEVRLNIMKQLKAELEIKSSEGQPPVFQKAKEFYQSCVDTDTIEAIGYTEIHNKLKVLGGWPLLQGQWDETTFDWISLNKAIAEQGPHYADQSIIGVGVESLHEDNTKSVVYIQSPNFGIDRRLLSLGLSDPVVYSYFKLMVDTAVELGEDEDNAKKELLDSLEFEMKLADLSLAVKNPNDTDEVISYYKVSDLPKEFPDLDWKGILNAILGEFVDITDDDVVTVYDSQFFQDLGMLLKNTPKRVMANYMIGRFLFYCKRFLTYNMAEITEQFDNSVDGSDNEGSRQDWCFKITTSYLPELMTVAYVRKYLRPETKEKATKITELIRQQLVNLVDKVEWMDANTRKKAIEKVNSVNLVVEYPPELTDDTTLEKYFEKLIFNKTGFFKNIVSVNQWWRFLDASKLHTKVDPLAWYNVGIQYGYENNVMYFYASNTLYALAGLFQGFFFDVDRPAFLNLATVGSAIGQEFTHAIDYDGSYDLNGNSWWSNSTTEAYFKKLDMVVKEYSTYRVKDNMTLEATAPDDVLGADQLGVKLARSALDDMLKDLKDPTILGLDQYSASQLFWLGYANTMCEKYVPELVEEEMEYSEFPPEEYRVNGPLRNSAQFSQDWKCSPGTYMNPGNRVTVW